MAEDHIRYDILAQEALRGVMRKVLAEVARTGLPGNHHFFITFLTGAPGVRISTRLHERYPEQMTIVIQFQYWDLKVTDTGFEVGLSFSDVPETARNPVLGGARLLRSFGQFRARIRREDRDAAESGRGNAAQSPRRRPEAYSAGEEGGAEEEGRRGREGDAACRRRCGQRAPTSFRSTPSARNSDVLPSSIFGSPASARRAPRRSRRRAKTAPCMDASKAEKSRDRLQAEKSAAFVEGHRLEPQSRDGKP